MKLRKTRTSLAILLALASVAANADESDKPEPTDLPAVQVPHQLLDTPLYASLSIVGLGNYGLGGALSAPSAIEQETDDRKDDCGETQGNPVVLYTGNKVEVEQDFASVGEMGLYLQRVYNHHWSATGLFGNHWLSNFDYSLAFSDGQNVAWAQQPDGRRIKFLFDPATNRWYEDRAQPVAYIVRTADGGFSLYNERRGVETYNADGYITQLRNEQGVFWNFAYESRYLQTVTHSSGRTVRFTWTNGQLTQVTDPAGTAFQYTYTADVFGTGRGRLASVLLPGSPATTVSYHYEDARYPGGLTGKSFNGVRYSTFAYDANKRAVLTEHAGGVERHTFSYAVQSSEQVSLPPAPIRPGGNAPSEGTGWCDYDPRLGYVCYAPEFPSVGLSSTAEAAAANQAPATKDRPTRNKTTEVNPLGRQTTYAYEDGKQVSITGDTSPRCPASYKEKTYDTNGNPDLVHDFVNNLTDFDYSPQGFRLKQVEAVGSAAQRTTTYEWDTARSRLVKETVQGDRQTEYGYEERGNIASITVRNISAQGVLNEGRTTHYRYAYHPNGLKAAVTVDGPLAQDEITLVFSSSGDLLSVTNALGHAVVYTNHDALGRPGRVISPNGGIAETTYDARGRVATQRNNMGNGWATTTLSYDGTGNLASVTRPDGIAVRYEYDAARRRLGEVEARGDGTYAWTRFEYDAASNITRTELRHTDYPMDSSVVGMIDGVAHDGQWNWYVAGWACATGATSSIDVHAYAEGGILLGVGQASLAGEEALATKCHSSSSARRFHIPISLSQRQQLGGTKLTVFGLSPKGPTYNGTLGNSGVFTIPTAAVAGQVTGVTRDADWNYFAEGWACSVGVSAPIVVHLYAGGQSGVGTLATHGEANLPSDANVNAACQSTAANHRFRLPLDTNIRQTQGGKSIHVHGISPTGQGHLVIADSGSHAIPEFTRTASFIQYFPERDIIANGESTMISAMIRNTGNVVWRSETQLLWGEGLFDRHVALPHTVAPGQDVQMQVAVAPVNTNNWPRTVSYVARLASGGTAWGPQGHAVVQVTNIMTPECEWPQECVPEIGLRRKQPITAQEGAR